MDSRNQGVRSTTADIAKDGKQQSASVDWDYLPEDILARILARLPFSSLIRSRRVCKKWNGLKFCSDFTFSGNLKAKCVPIYFFEGPLRVYNSGTNQWEVHSLAFLGVPLQSLALINTGGGLLCFKRKCAPEFVICNPITKRWRIVPLPVEFDHEEIRPPMGEIWTRKLPIPNIPVISSERNISDERRMENRVAYQRAREDYQRAREDFQRAKEAYHQEFGRDVIVSLLSRKDEKGFKLLVAGIHDGRQRATLIYESVTGVWTRGAEVPRGTRFWGSGKTLLCNGFLYCITWSHGLPEGVCDLASPWSIVRYNVKGNRWSEYPLNAPGVTLPQLLTHRGKGYVAQRRVKKNQVEVTFSELNMGAPMSMIMYKFWPMALLYLNPDEIEIDLLGDWCMGQGDWLYLARGRRDGCLMEGLPVVAHDMTMHSWTKMSVLRDAFKESPMWLRTFEASLTASV